MATYQNAFLIYNPNAGKLNRKRDDLLQRTIASLAAVGQRVHPIPTSGPLTAADIARDCIGRGADLILACGGDGTINEVTNGLAGSRVPLGILPAGTANVMAVELGLGADPALAAQQLPALTPVRIATGLIESDSMRRHFVLMAGAGLDALIVYNIDAKLKASLGKVAYWASGFSQLGKRLAEFEVQTNGCRSRCSFALASRVRNYGGDLYIARNASLFSDHFELVLFEGAHTLPYMKYLLGVLTGRLAKMSGIRILQVQSLELSGGSDPGIYVQVDGEYAGRLPVRLSIVPDALTLLVPETFRRKRENG